MLLRKRSTSISYEIVYNQAMDFFHGDKDKLHMWWMKKIDHLDNKAPYELVKEGKGRLLLKFLHRNFYEK